MNSGWLQNTQNKTVESKNRTVNGDHNFSNSRQRELHVTQVCTKKDPSFEMTLHI